MRTLVLSSLLLGSLALAQPQPLLSRELLLGNPERTDLQVSPDGKQLAWRAPDASGILQVWVRGLDAASESAVAVTADKKRPVRNFHWAEDSQALLYLQDQDGDENFHVFQVELGSKNVRDLTPFQGVRAGLLATHPRFPRQLLVTLNLRDRKLMDVHRISLDTGAVELDTQNPGDVNDWVVDAQHQVRGAIAITSDGGHDIRVRDSVKSPWRSLVKTGPEENVRLHGFTLDGKGGYLTTSIDSDTERVVEKNLKSGVERQLGKSQGSDVLGLLIHPTKFVVQAIAFDVDGRSKWTSLEGAVRNDLELLGKSLSGDLEVVSRDLADARWVVKETRDLGPQRYFLFDRATRQHTLAFSTQPKLETAALAPMKPLKFKARDGLELPAYLTVPANAPKNAPLVLLVHGGPWWRDFWGYSGLVQLLANRGYGVLQVNFRGSTGYGKRFLHAGDKQWALAMHTDLLDAVAFVTADQSFDAKKVCIVGTSYGGYAALAGAAFTPDTFKCAVDIVGPSNLFTLLKTVPPYWAAFKLMLNQRLGDPDSAADREYLTQASPLFSAQNIKIPLLIGQGANDPRVKQAESEQIVAALEQNGQPVTYVVYPDEGHGFARPENRTDFYARTEQFLAEHLGGRFEPLPKEGKVPGSTGVIKTVKRKK